MPSTSKLAVSKSPTALVSTSRTERTSGLSFAEAIQELTSGGRVTKAEWGTNDIYLQVVDDKLMIFKTEDNKFHPLIVQHADMAGTDWIVLANN